eukprot:GSA25T00020072001.1
MRVYPRELGTHLFYDSEDDSASTLESSDETREELDRQIQAQISEKIDKAMTMERNAECAKALWDGMEGSTQARETDEDARSGQNCSDLLNFERQNKFLGPRTDCDAAPKNASASRRDMNSSCTSSPTSANKG